MIAANAYHSKPYDSFKDPLTDDGSMTRGHFSPYIQVEAAPSEAIHWKIGSEVFATRKRKNAEAGLWMA